MKLKGAEWAVLPAPDYAKAIRRAEDLVAAMVEAEAAAVARAKAEQEVKARARAAMEAEHWSKRRRKELGLAPDATDAEVEAAEVAIAVQVGRAFNRRAQPTPPTDTQWTLPTDAAS